MTILAALLTLAGTIIISMILLLMWLITVAVSITSYILTGISFSGVAKRRGLKCGWLAFVPLLNVWTLGSISDNYQLTVKGKNRKFCHVLLWLMVATMIFSCIYGLVNALSTIISLTGIGAVIMLVLLLITFCVASVVSLVYQVFYWIALHDYFQSCNPEKAGLYLILSIFVPFAFIVLAFKVRDLDLGMPSVENEAFAE